MPYVKTLMAVTTARVHRDGLANSVPKVCLVQNVLAVYYLFNLVTLLDVDECSNDEIVCFNGGTCENRVGSYSCICPSGWTGSQCAEGM